MNKDRRIDRLATALIDANSVGIAVEDGLHTATGHFVPCTRNLMAKILDLLARSAISWEGGGSGYAAVAPRSGPSAGICWLSGDRGRNAGAMRPHLPARAYRTSASSSWLGFTSAM
jgi:hypothetical protein